MSDQARRKVDRKRYIVRKTIHAWTTVSATDPKEAMLLADEQPLDGWYHDTMHSEVEPI